MASIPIQPVAVVFQSVSGALPRKQLRAFAGLLSRDVAGGRAFSCLITSDGELQRLNRAFRGKNSPTDVLSFPSVELKPGAPLPAYLGDVAISAETAARQAEEFGHTLGEELRILMLHGLLHLLGLDHESDRGRMKRIEQQWREKLGLPAGLIERTEA